MKNFLYLSRRNMTTVEEAFEKFKQLPDWDRFPMPEVFYEHFKVKKPQPLTSAEIVNWNPITDHLYSAPGPVEIREPAPGGVREIKDYQTLPVEVKRLTDSGELEDYPPPAPPKTSRELMEDYFQKIGAIKVTTNQNGVDMNQYLSKDSLTRPTEDNTINIRVWSDLPSSSPSGDVSDTAAAVRDHDAE